jgi:hypothetical protein
MLADAGESAIGAFNTFDEELVAMKTIPMILMMAAAALLAAGCATKSQGVRMYPGAARPVGEVAQLVVASEFNVKSVDGARAGEGFFASASETVYEVLPGRREVVARFYSPFEGGISSGGGMSYDKPDRSGFQTLRFDAAPGRRYAIKRKTENRDIVLFLEELGPAETLTQVVAMKPAEKETIVIKKPETTAPKVETTTSAAPAKPEQVEAPQITPLDNLKQWWFYASTEQRALFRKWIDTAK